MPALVHLEVAQLWSSTCCLDERDWLVDRPASTRTSEPVVTGSGDDLDIWTHLYNPFEMRAQYQGLNTR